MFESFIQSEIDYLCKYYKKEKVMEKIEFITKYSDKYDQHIPLPSTQRRKGITKMDHYEMYLNILDNTYRLMVEREGGVNGPPREPITKKRNKKTKRKKSVVL